MREHACSSMHLVIHSLHYSILITHLFNSIDKELSASQMHRGKAEKANEFLGPLQHSQ